LIAYRAHSKDFELAAEDAGAESVAVNQAANM
jgi:hypothetical protein